MLKSIDEYLPKRMKKDTIQGRVPREIVQEVKKLLKKDHRKISDLLTALLQRYLDEKCPKK